MNTTGQPTPDRLMQMAWGYAPPLIIETAVRTKVFDSLANGPRTVEELSKHTGASARGLTAILNALVGLQLLSRAGELYSLTPESAAFLVSTSPAYHGGFFKHLSTQLIPNWLQLDEITRTGKPAQAVNRHERASFFAEFVESIFPLSYPAAKAFGQHLGLPKASSPVSVLDLAAGSGVWGIALAELSKQVRVNAVDWAEVLGVTKSVAAKHGVADQLNVIAGDLITVDFGRNHNIATLGHILHSEGPDRSRKLLKKTFDALAPGGTIAIMEFVPNDDRTGPPAPLIFAVNMLVNTEAGDTFTFLEIKSWLLEAGFVETRQLDVPAVSPLILAQKSAK